jgi:uncharacterized protein YtpQ (UPF0354 family)
LDDVIDRFIQGVAKSESEERAGNKAFAEVRERIFPRLMTAQQWMSKRDEGARLVIRSLAQDLGATLIVDEGDSFAYVQLGAIPAWEIDSQTAYEVAYANLARAASFHTTRSGEGVETLLIDSSPNAPTRVLLPDKLQEWQSDIEGEMVLGMPTQNLLLGFSRQHPAFDELREQVAIDAQASPNGLLGTLLHVRQGAIELFS